MKEIKEFQGFKEIKEKKEKKMNENKVLQEFEAGLRFKNRFKDEGNQGTSTT